MKKPRGTVLPRKMGLMPGDAAFGRADSITPGVRRMMCAVLRAEAVPSPGLFRANNLSKDGVAAGAAVRLAAPGGGCRCKTVLVRRRAPPRAPAWPRQLAIPAARSSTRRIARPSVAHRRAADRCIGANACSRSCSRSPLRMSFTFRTCAAKCAGSASRRPPWRSRVWWPSVWPAHTAPAKGPMTGSRSSGPTRYRPAGSGAFQGEEAGQSLRAGSARRRRSAASRAQPAGRPTASPRYTG